MPSPPSPYGLSQTPAFAGFCNQGKKKEILRGRSLLERILLRNTVSFAPVFLETYEKKLSQEIRGYCTSFYTG